MSDKKKEKENKQIEKVMTDLGLQVDEPQQIAVTNTSDAQMYKEHLSLLIARGKTKEFIGKTITYYDLDRMSEKDLEKYYKLYEATQASRINQSVTNGIINAYTEICGLIIKPKKERLEKLNSDLKNDYLVRDQLEQWVSHLSFKMGPFMPLVSAAMITFENLHTINGERGEERREERGEVTGGTTGEETGETDKKAKNPKAD